MKTKSAIILFFLLISTSYANNFVSNAYELNNILKSSIDDSTIFLKEGIYKGNFDIKKRINLIGLGNVVITSISEKNPLTINDKNVTINNIIIYNSGKNISNKNSCIFVNGEKNTIYNCIFSECGFGIWLNSSSLSYISSNIFIGTDDEMLSNRGNTIQVYKSNNSVISNNFIINGRDGIYISNSQEVSISKNIFSNVRFGIHYMFSNKCSVVANLVSDSLIGIAVMYSKYVDLINNFCYYNSNHGLFFRDVFFSRIIRNKSLYNNTGILIGDSYFNDLINNDIVKNKIGIKVYSGSDENLVYENNFINNRMQANFLDNRKIIWNSKSVGNFWSHYVGWDINMDGIGDKQFYITKISDKLVFSYGILKVILGSPSIILLQKIENQFPAFRKSAIIDMYPLMKQNIW